MRVTRDYGLISSKLEHDLLVRLNRDIIVAHVKAIEKSSDNERVSPDVEGTKRFIKENTRICGREV